MNGRGSGGALCVVIAIVLAAILFAGFLMFAHSNGKDGAPSRHHLRG